MRHSQLAFSIVALATAAFARPVLADEVHVTVDGVRSDKGHVICGIYRSADGFPRDGRRAVQVVKQPANPAGVSCNFSDLPAGVYAISTFHDENDDGVLNTNLLGRPKEGYGVSNNRVHSTRAPDFEESSFRLDAQTIALQIHLKY
jgi:uncharacterized protein (DUF2141 family)